MTRVSVFCLFVLAFAPTTLNAAEEPLANPRWDMVQIPKRTTGDPRVVSATKEYTLGRELGALANDSTRPNSNGAKWGKPHHCCNVNNVAIYGVWQLPDTNCP